MKAPKWIKNMAFRHGDGSLSNATHAFAKINLILAEEGQLASWLHVSNL